MFIYIYTFLKIRFWVYIRKLEPLPSEKDYVHVYVYKCKKKRNLFIYNKRDTMQKSRQFALRLYMQKERRVTLHHFLWNCWNWYLYTKNITLCATWKFYIFKKTETSQKPGQFALRFIYIKPDYLRYAISHGILKLTKGGGNFYMTKNSALYATFLYAMNFALRFSIQKPDTLR